MILHIFKKDVRLLWPIAIAVALLNVVRVVLTLVEGYGSRAQSLSPLGYSTQELCIFATGFLIILAVQKDALAGTKQDWLVRPISRTQLLLSKLLFVVLVVRLPELVIDLAECVAAGFPLSKAFAVAVGRAVWVFVTIDILAFTFAALTTKLTEVIVAGVAIVAAMGLFQSFFDRSGTSAQGVFWVVETLQTLLVLASAAVVISLLYYRRKTAASRLIFGTALVTVALMSALFPWQKAFAIEELLASEPAAARAIQLSYTPGAEDSKLNINGRRPGGVLVSVDLQVKGLNSSQRLREDHLTARLTESNGISTDITVPYQTGDAGVANFRQPLLIPAALMSSLRGHSVRLDLDLAVTLLQQKNPEATLAQGEEKYIEGMGSCSSTRSLTNVDFRCYVPGQAPCTASRLESAATGKVFDMSRPCPANYGPSFEQTQNEAVTGFRGTLNFRDPISFQPLRSLSEAETKDMRIVLQTYRPIAHFTRHITIEGFRIGPVQ
jgi:hypothetical protein